MWSDSRWARRSGPGEWLSYVGKAVTVNLLRPKNSGNPRLIKTFHAMLDKLTASLKERAVIKWSTSMTLDIIRQTAANWSLSDWSVSTIIAVKNPTSAWVALSHSDFDSCSLDVWSFLSPTTHVTAIMALNAEFMIQFLWTIIAKSRKFRYKMFRPNT